MMMVILGLIERVVIVATCYLFMGFDPIIWFLCRYGDMR